MNGKRRCFAIDYLDQRIVRTKGRVGDSVGHVRERDEAKRLLRLRQRWRQKKRYSKDQCSGEYSDHIGAPDNSITASIVPRQTSTSQ